MSEQEMRPRILVVDDDAKIRALLSEMLAEQGYEVVAAADGTEALQRVDENDLSLVLLDFQLPDIDGLAVLEESKRRRPALPVVMVSGFGTVKLAVDATRRGAYDFIEKPPEPERVAVVIKNALEQDRLRSETVARYEMVGTSAPMQRLYATIDRVAPSKASVLILGESGAGKELAARAIHRKSAVADGPFVRINCAAIPQELIESELFGHEKGAFTGAVAQKPGKLELADKGTVLLDEVGDMNLHVQAKLLRFLQEGEFEHVGGTRTIRVDVRTLAATNKSLAEEMKHRRFREDLYFRLNVVSLVVPPLRDRRDDIPQLADHFLEKYCDEHGVPRKTLGPDALNLLASRPWPGNVREFANAIQRCVVMLPGGVLTAHDVSPLLVAGDCAPDESPARQSLREARDEFDRKYVLGVLADSQWSMTEAARVLQIDRTSLYRLMDRLGIANPAS